MDNLRFKPLAVIMLLIASQALTAACGPGAGALSPESLARRETATISKDSRDFKILGSYPTPDGKKLVVYTFSIASEESQDAYVHLGFVLAEASRWGLWYPAGAGDYSRPAIDLIGEAIEYETTYQPGVYSAVFGRVLKPPLTIEANLDNGKVFIDRDGDEGFAFFGSGDGDPVQLSVLDRQEKLVETIHLDIKENLALEALLSFLQNLHTGDYSSAAELYGGSYQALIDNNPELDPQDSAALWKNACETNGFQCLDIYSYGVREHPSADEFVIAVQFQDEQGNYFILGPCCGASEMEMPPRAEFYFHVIKDATGRYKVMDLPPYVP